MEQTSLSFAAWFWLLVPMLGVVMLSIVTYFIETKRDNE
jgi:hypothetical protein